MFRRQTDPASGTEKVGKIILMLEHTVTVAMYDYWLKCHLLFVPLSHAWLLRPHGTVACQAFVHGFYRWEYRNRMSFPSSRDLLDEVEPASSHAKLNSSTTTKEVPLVLKIAMFIILCKKWKLHCLLQTRAEYQCLTFAEVIVMWLWVRTSLFLEGCWNI